VTIGALAALASAAMYAITVLTVRMMTRTETTEAITLWPMVLLSVLGGLYVAPSWVPIRAEHWGWLAATGLFGAIGQRMITEAFRLAPASVVTPFEYTALIYGVIIDWVLWHTVPSARMFLGGSVVIASGLFLIWRERQLHLATKTPRPPPP
jgi:drug/metabolite transporter (DMT)-like permease